MGSPLFHVSATAMCPHGGQVSTVPGSPRVSLGGQPAATMGDTFLTAGCAFTVPPATRVRIGVQFAILQSSSGLCQSAEHIPGGPPSVVVSQLRVTGQ